MSQPICLKCSSTKIDDGRSYVVAGLGMCLSVAAFLSVVEYTPSPAVIDWTTYNSAAHGNIQVAAVMILGIFMAVNGLTRSKRMRCRKCGASWKPARADLRLDWKKDAVHWL